MPKLQPVKFFETRFGSRNLDPSPTYNVKKLNGNSYEYTYLSVCEWAGAPSGINMAKRIIEVKAVQRIFL